MQCIHSGVNWQMGYASFTGTAYLGRWEPSAEAGFEGCTSIFAVSSLLALSFTSKSLVGIVP